MDSDLPVTTCLSPLSICQSFNNVFHMSLLFWTKNKIQILRRPIYYFFYFSNEIYLMLRGVGFASRQFV